MSAINERIRLVAVEVGRVENGFTVLRNADRAFCRQRCNIRYRQAVRAVHVVIAQNEEFLFNVFRHRIGIIAIGRCIVDRIHGDCKAFRGCFHVGASIRYRQRNRSRAVFVSRGQHLNSAFFAGGVVARAGN